MTRDLQRWDDDGGRTDRYFIPAPHSQFAATADSLRMTHDPLIRAASSNHDQPGMPPRRH